MLSYETSVKVQISWREMNPQLAKSCVVPTSSGLDRTSSTHPLIPYLQQDAHKGSLASSKKPPHTPTQGLLYDTNLYK